MKKDRGIQRSKSLLLKIFIGVVRVVWISLLVTVQEVHICEFCGAKNDVGRIRRALNKYGNRRKAKSKWKEMMQSGSVLFNLFKRLRCGRVWYCPKLLHIVEYDVIFLCNMAWDKVQKLKQ